LESARVPFDQGSQKGRKFNAGYYTAEILEPLSQWRSIEAAGNGRKLLVHANNARPHTAKLSTQYFNENRMKSSNWAIEVELSRVIDFTPGRN
jgi:hypothetical protein